tara:strand:+ start:669 stop:1103 length:435 start_codon:yes stop_codon:yes gene_type:complete
MQDENLELTAQNESNFDRWYICYPKKQARETARKAWDKQKLDKIFSTIMIKSRAFVEHYRTTGKMDFLPMPATFLNQRRWEDEFDTKPVYESRATESKPADMRIRMYNGSVSARSSERESVEDNCKEFNKLMTKYDELHRDYNY